MIINNNLTIIENNIEKALRRAGRTGDKVHIVAVTKTVETDRIIEALEIGLDNIGENRVQELVQKYDIIGKGPKYHMIGHLQSNKAKDIIDKVTLIHSLDRASLSREIDKRAKARDIIADVLIQVNVAGEESKHGLRVDEVIPFIEETLQYSNIRIKGLMTIAPFVEEAEEVRWVFREMRKLYDEINARGYEGVDMEFLSMGMTNDYEVAIEEGSNMIRVGTGLFGERK
ncbi:MAG: YggS family pyridoxal phosphate-dependent enzyme [Tissierellia bacterium]|nr:YggS family pyridoxal phosphate-dependent enzyme [Tissierellia bacterium]